MSKNKIQLKVNRYLFNFQYFVALKKTLTTFQTIFHSEIDFAKIIRYFQVEYEFNLQKKHKTLINIRLKDEMAYF